MAKRKNKQIEPKEKNKEIKKEIKEEAKISLSVYLVRANIKRQEWPARKVYAAKHIPELQATLKEWTTLFKKY